MAPDWLTYTAWVYLALCFVSAALISADIAFAGRRQPMAVMNLVFPVTALYFGPAALAYYLRFARARPREDAPPAHEPAAAPARAVHAGHSGDAGPADVDMSVDATSDAHRDHGGMDGRSEPAHAGHGAPGRERERPGWVAMAAEVSHCGSGCSLGDLVSEFGIFAAGLTVAGSMLWAEFIGDYVLALAFGILFQYFAIAPMRGLGVRAGLAAAAKADVVSLTAFEVGLFGWMALTHYVLFPAPHPLTTDSAAFWLLMQVGMMIGFATAWPANVWLVRRGIKTPM